MSFWYLELLYGFLLSWGIVIVLFYGLLEHRKERFRVAIVIATFGFGLLASLALGLLSGKAAFFLAGWMVPCVLHLLFGRAPGMFVLGVLNSIFRGKANRKK